MTRALAAAALLLAACGGGAAPPSHGDAHACSADADCAILLRPCCTPCAPWTENDVEAVRRDELDARRHALCPEPVTCPQCVAFPPSADLVAVCRASRCEVGRR